MDIVRLVRAVKTAEENVNQIFQEFRSSTGAAEKKEFYSLRLQAAMFQYELLLFLVGYFHSNPKAFAARIALKDFLHKIFEYRKLVTKNQINRVVVLAEKRGVASQAKKLQDAYVSSKTSFKLIDTFDPLRNATSGHYDPDIDKQVSELHRIQPDTAIAAVQKFLAFNFVLLNVLKDIGGKQDVTGYVEP